MNLIKTHSNSVKDWIVQQVLFDKMNNPLGYISLLLFGLGLAYGISILPLKIGVLVIGGLIAIPVVFACFFNLYLGVSVMLFLGFFISLIGKYTSAPIGTLMDGFLLLLLFGLLVRLVKKRDFRFAKSPISILIIAWIYYNLMEVLNPWAGSRMAWVYTVRSVAILLCLYFVACYALSSLQRIKNILKLIIGLSFLAALYALKQEFLGFSAAELAWLHADEERFMLIFQWSRLRVFSFFSDPTTFGILMGYMGVFCFIIALGPYKMWQRLLSAFAGVCMMMGMAYAGSRTPFVLIPAGFFFYFLLTFSRKTIIIFAGVLVLGGGLMMKSTSSAVMYRIQSAFKPGEDASVQVRLDNQKLIQPFIRSHPIGAGLGSTGVWGKRFTPNSWLSSFAHDSLYVRLATEAGWIGLLLYMALLMVTLRYGIYYCFRVKDPQIKNLYIGVTAIVFILTIANYPQEAITLPPTSIFFYVLLAVLVRLKDFDENFKPAESSS